MFSFNLKGNGNAATVLNRSNNLNRSFCVAYIHTDIHCVHSAVDGKTVI